MALVTEATIGHLADLIPSWERLLRQPTGAQHHQGYAEAARQLNAFLEAKKMPTEVAKLRREHIGHFIVHLVQTCKPPAAVNRFRSLQQLFGWREEGARWVGRGTVAPDERRAQRRRGGLIRRLVPAFVRTSFRGRAGPWPARDE